MVGVELLGIGLDSPLRPPLTSLSNAIDRKQGVVSLAVRFARFGAIFKKMALFKISSTKLVEVQVNI